MIHYCDNPNCECEAVEQVKVSEVKPHDSKRWLCQSCYEVYFWGVQHGREHEAMNHGVLVGNDSSQVKPKKY